MALFSSFRFLVIVLVLQLLVAMAWALNGTINPSFPGAILFGDSIMDTGNNNVLTTAFRCDFPPYGKDFAGHRPTGRFSNGKVASDFIAYYMGIKELLPAYLSPELKHEDLLTGVSFASGGTGYDPLTANIGSVLSLPEQLELFKEYKRKLQEIAGGAKAAAIIQRSLYVVCAGSNDVALTYFGGPFRRNHFDFPAYSTFLVHQASTFVQELYGLGARKIAVTGLPPIGCLPSQRTAAGGNQRDCVVAYNRASENYNHELAMQLRKLSSKLSEGRIVYADLYTNLLDMIQHPTKFGFKEAKKGCCGTGDFELGFLCNDLTSYTCDDDSQYVFWDSFHPTQKAYQVLVKLFVKEAVPLLL